MQYVLDEAQLNEIISSLGANHGFTHASGEFVEFDNFKVQWSRGYRFVHFRVSDYMVGINAGVVSDIIESLFERIEGKSKGAYSEEAAKCLLSKEFREVNRDMYLRRKELPVDKRLTLQLKALRHEYRDKKDCADVHEALDDLVICNNEECGIGTSALFKVIAFSKKVDEESDEFLRKLILIAAMYLHCQRKAFGKDADVARRIYDSEMAKLEEMPEFKDVKAYMDAEGLRF